MTNVRIIFSDNDIFLPDGTCLGVQGEHNAVQFVITLPDDMVVGMTYHTVTINGKESALIVSEHESTDGAYRVGNTIYFPLSSAWTQETNADLYVTAYKQIGQTVQVVDKTQTVYGLRFLPSGKAADIKPGGLAAEVHALEEKVDEMGDSSILPKLDAKNNRLQYEGKDVCNVIVVHTMEDFENIEEESLVLVPQEIVFENRTFNAGFYKKTASGVVQISTFATEEEKTNWNAAHQKTAVLDKYGTAEEGTVPQFNGAEIALQSAVDDLESEIAMHHPTDTLIPLALDTTYPTLTIRPDWACVPVYSVDDNPVVCRIASESEMGGIPVSEIRLYYLTDYQTGMPVPTLRVITGGDLYICYAAQFHDMGQTYAAGWYDAEGTQLDAAPTLENMRFDYFVVSNNEEITDFTGLSGESLCALQTISRMVNVSAAAIGSLGVVENGVQRLTHAPQANKAYHFVTANDIVLNLPTITWTHDDLQMVIYLDCTSNIDVTFPTGTEFIGDVPNTETGKHKLIFVCFRNTNVWSVGGIDSEDS